MRARRGAMAVALLLTALSSMCGAFEAEMGARFADAYTAFAPLFLFHRSYADHLFLGTGIEIPIHLVESCQSFSYQLALLQIDLIEQTASHMPETMNYVLRLRMEQAAYCDRHSATLEEIVAGPEVDLDMLDAASDFGLFSGIQALGDLLELALDAALGELEWELGPWRFAVAFSMRGILNQHPVERIDANLREILYGAEGATRPPLPVPDAVADAMAGVIELSGRDLGEEDAALAVGHAAIVYRFLIEDEQEAVP
ncbi:hypothetical protein KJ567_00770 [Candidatus Bipolaricaulota bacterium]|nr:hypothetical protein [Candidatus Bipolaricaulota bacterium]